MPIPMPTLSVQESGYMPDNHPKSGEIYRSRQFTGQKCEIIRVTGTQVEIHWVGDDPYTEPQLVPVSRFNLEFELSAREADL